MELTEMDTSGGSSGTKANYVPLPARTYWAEDYYKLEQEKIFSKAWRYVGHQSEFVSPGDYGVFEFSDQSIFVIRGKDGELRAFFNVCQHRAAQLLEGRGNAKNFVVCPYHSWSYDHAGCLRSASNSQCVDGFDKSRFTLSTLNLEVWCGFVFVNFDKDAEPLKVKMAELESSLRRFCPIVESMKLAKRVDYSVKSNWKALVDNFVENYHLSLSGPAHKAFTNLVDCKNFKVTTTSGGEYTQYAFSTFHAPEGDANNAAYEYTKQRSFGGNNDFVSYHMFPDIGFVLLPGCDALLVFILAPDGPETCAELMDYFTPTGASDAETMRGVEYFSNVLGPEDNDLVEKVQRGLRSQGYRSGALMVDRDNSGISEHAVKTFHDQVRALTGVS